MNRRLVVLVTIAATSAAGVAPALASHAGKAKPLKGTLSFTDFTPDPTVEVAENNPVDPAKTGDCSTGKLPSGPADVNTHTIKVSGPGTLTVAGGNKLDWAMEITDAKGTYLSGSDGATPNVAEGTSYDVPKAGAYRVTYCNLTGEPTITASYTFKPR